MSSSQADFNAQIVEEFRTNGGDVGGMFEGMPLVLLHHMGAKSGKSYINPLAYLGDGDRYVIFGSKGGAPVHPAWYHNLKANPEVTIEVGSDTIDVVAGEATGDERDRLYSAQSELVPAFAEYAAKTDGVRTIPVVVLTPAGA
jgi:deazaflavin-dependent oxidoreductase (nitroreductase family)